MANKSKNKSDSNNVIRQLIVSIVTFRSRFKLIRALVFDKRVPRWQKVIPFLPLVYILSPFNFLNFAIPFFGQIDDIMLLFAAFDMFERVIDDKILREYQKKIQVN